MAKATPDTNFLICLAFAVIALLLNLVGFVSPYWIVSREDLNSEFVRIGIWVACFNNYEHPEDYVSKKYSGCWYTYWPEYSYIRYWLNPPWFYAVQLFSSLSFVCNILAVLILLAKFLRFMKLRDIKTNLATMYIQLFAVCCDIIVIVAMGVMSKDRNWMPKPDHNYLSWSYGFAVVGSFFTLFCLFNLFIDYLVHNRAPAYREKCKKYNKIPLEKVADNIINKSNVGSGIYKNVTGSTIYSQVSKPPFGITSGATASAKVRDAMSQKKNPYGGSVSSLNSLGQLNKAASTHSLASMGFVHPPLVIAKGSMSSLHSISRPIRNGYFSSNDSEV